METNWVLAFLVSCSASCRILYPLCVIIAKAEVISFVVDYTCMCGSICNCVMLDICFKDRFLFSSLTSWLASLVVKFSLYSDVAEKLEPFQC